MCELQTLSCCYDGYVIRCKCCGYAQVAFGTSLISLSPDDFEGFLRIMRSICDSEEARSMEEYKNIAVPTPYPAVSITLSPGEAFELLTIIEKADTEIKTQDLMQLFD